MPQNVQLSSKESVKVFTDERTGRILGLCPEFAKLLNVPTGIRYREHVCLHAREIENWVAKLRIQQERDAEIATLRQIEQEKPFRKCISDGIKERDSHVNQFNKDLNRALMRLNNDRYDEIMEAKKHPQMSTLAESSNLKPGDNETIDFAMASPAFREPGDQRATGAAVRGDLIQIARDKRA